ncbi:site-specific DNA-methyltransferase, partial [bacterium]|nr:site-specific DNA-methyltransferase [bacterium]
PFCGCGTTVHAAEKLNRSWIGIDITHLAINLIRTRLDDAFPGIEIEIHGLPASYAGALELARADKHEFELWVLGEMDAMPFRGGRRGADTGIDGYLFFRYLEGEKVLDGKAVVEVKGGGTGVKDVGYLDAVVEREMADLGILVSALKPSKKMYEHAAGRGTVTLGTREYPRLQVIWVKDLMENRARLEYPEAGRIEYTKTAPKHQREDQLKLGD